MSTPTRHRSYITGMILGKVRSSAHSRHFNLGNQGVNSSPLKESLGQAPRGCSALRTALTEAAGAPEALSQAHPEQQHAKSPRAFSGGEGDNQWQWCAVSQPGRVKIREGLETRLAVGEHLGGLWRKDLCSLKSGHWLPSLPLSQSAV